MVSNDGCAGSPITGCKHSERSTDISEVIEMGTLMTGFIDPTKALCNICKSCTVSGCHTHSKGLMTFVSNDIKVQGEINPSPTVKWGNVG